MTELTWSLSWTLVTVGACWLVMSCAIALALGRIIQRSKATTTSERSEAQRTEDFGIEDESLCDEGASRAASGTRLKPVKLDGEAKPQRKVS